MDFGTYLDKRRKAWHISRKELAVQIDVSEKTIERWEKGIQYPPMDKAEDIMNFFGDKLKVEIYDLSRFWEEQP